MELTPGMIIAGRYRIDSRIGAGGMGEVWVGEHLSVGSRVALKTLLPAAALNHEVVARFRREAVFLSRIRSDYVARVVDFVEDPAVGLALVMEFIDGDPLSKILQQKTLTVEEALELSIDIVSALRDLHFAKIIHRDLKPGNIIIQRRYDGASRAVIVDFGVSRLVKGSAEDEEMTGITRADMAVGTIEYMAPEQILNSRDVTPTSDLYAVGAILFRAVAGHHVFGDLYDVELAKTKLTKDPPPLQTGRRDRVAKGFEDIVARALKRKPKERYDTAERLLGDLVGLREVSRVSQIDEMETTRDNSKASIPIYTDSTSSPSVTRPRLSTASPQPSSAPPSPGRASAASLPPAEPSVTLKSAQPSGRGSLTGAESGTIPPRRRGISLGAALALVLVALAGGAGLGVALLQGKLKGLLPQAAESTPTVTPMPSAEVAAAPPPSATPPPVETAAPSAEPTAEEIDLDSPAGSASAPAPSAVKPASTIAVAPPSTAPKPAPKPTSTDDPPAPKPSTTSAPSSSSTGAAPTPVSTATSTDAAAPKPRSTSSSSPSPQQPKPVPSSSPPPVSNPGF